MTESERLWEKWGSDIPTNYHNFLMTKTDFKNALADYDPWVYDRPPTREDGDERGRVEVYVVNPIDPRKFNTYDMHYSNDRVKGRPWRVIKRPKKG